MSERPSDPAATGDEVRREVLGAVLAVDGGRTAV
jgi:hypothetical protein